MLGKLMMEETFRVYVSWGYKNIAKINRSDYFFLLELSVWFLSGILSSCYELRCLSFGILFIDKVNSEDLYDKQKNQGIENFTCRKVAKNICALYGAFFLFGKKRNTSIKFTLGYSRIFKIRNISNSEQKMVILTYTKHSSVILCELHFVFLIYQTCIF